MRITEVAVGTDDLDGAARHYGEVLGLPVVRTDAAVVVSVGRTTLRLELRTEAVCEHLALSIAPGALPGARAWLLERTELLTRDGQEEFEGPPGWDSRSVYFSGPSRSVLELIERRRLPVPRHSGAFGPAGLLSISEVGIAVEDVPAAVAALGDAGLRPFAGSSSQDFAAVGDEDGLLILATSGRMWLPTEDRPATPSATRITAVTDRSAEILVGGAELALGS